MDDKLILSVFNFPELYNVTLPNYRCTESRSSAWRSISILMGVSSEECKRKWKNLRDRYLKEVRLEIKSKQQGEVIPSRWKYRQLLNFIAPFTGSRHHGILENYGGNNDDDGDNPDSDPLSPQGHGMSSEAVKTPQALAKPPGSLPDSKSQLGFVTQLPSVAQETQTSQLALMTNITSAAATARKSGKKRRFAREGLSLPSSPSLASPAKRHAREEDCSFANRPQDEDELFMLSFVPALKRLGAQKRCETKMRIQQIMYEAEFVAEPGALEKPKEAQTPE